MLMDAKAGLNHKNKKDSMALMWVVDQCHDNFVGMLVEVEAGAGLKVQNIVGFVVLIKVLAMAAFPLPLCSSKPKLNLTIRERGCALLVT